MEESLWSHLPLLLRSNTKDSLEFILQSLWRTRNTGLDSSDREIFRDMLQLHSDSDLDPLLVCLRSLIRRCVYEDDIQRLFPSHVLPELQRLLTLMLHKFQRQWREDIDKDKMTLPGLKAMTWDMVNQESDSRDHSVAVISLKLQSEKRTRPKETEVKFQLGKETLQTMLESMNCIRDQLSGVGEASNGHLSKEANLG